MNFIRGHQKLLIVGSGILMGGLLAQLYLIKRRRLREGGDTEVVRGRQTLHEYISSRFNDPKQAAAFRRSVALVRESWGFLKPTRTELTAHDMYQRLLETDPTTRAVFADHVDWSKQERLFIVMISNLLTHMDDPHWVETNLSQLGKHHHDLGVRVEHFSSMRQSILSSLETQLQEKWNDDYAQAWIEVFDFISRVMIKSARSGIHTPSVSTGSISERLYSEEDHRTNRIPKHLRDATPEDFNAVWPSDPVDPNRAH